MATPRQVIDAVLESLVRPEFVALAEKNFYGALKCAHGISRYQRDIKEILVPSTQFDSATGVLSVPLPSSMRQAVGFKFWQGYNSGTQTPFNQAYQAMEFKNAWSNLKLVDYYGIDYPYTYIINGTNFKFKGLDSSIVAVTVEALSWPTFVFDTLEQDYISDSWILREYHKIVEAYLFVELARKQSSKDVKQSAQAALSEAYNDFSSLYSGEVICL